MLVGRTGLGPTFAESLSGEAEGCRSSCGHGSAQAGESHSPGDGGGSP